MLDDSDEKSRIFASFVNDNKNDDTNHLKCVILKSRQGFRDILDGWMNWNWEHWTFNNKNDELIISFVIYEV